MVSDLSGGYMESTQSIEASVIVMGCDIQGRVERPSGVAPHEAPRRFSDAAAGVPYA